MDIKKLKMAEMHSRGLTRMLISIAQKIEAGEEVSQWDLDGVESSIHCIRKHMKAAKES